MSSATQIQFDRLCEFAHDLHCGEPGRTLADQSGLDDCTEGVLTLCAALRLQIHDHGRPITDPERVKGMCRVLDLLGTPRDLMPLFAMQLEGESAEFQRKAAP